MHAVVMPFSPAFLTIFSFIASPTPCCPFLPLAMLQSPLKKMRYPDAEIRKLRPFWSPASDDVTTLCSTDFQQGVDVPNTIDAVDRCCANVERTERKLLQPRPRPDGLVYLVDGLPLRRFPHRLFRANALRLPLSSSRCFLPRFLPSFFRRVGCGNPTTPRLLHHRRCRLLACALRAFLFSSLWVPRFPRRRCPNFATAAASRCCWQACTVSIDEFSHQPMS